MHCPITKGYVPMVGKGVLLKKIKIKPLDERLTIHGGAISSNRIVGITSNAVRAPPSNSMAAVSIGAGIDFSKHVKQASKSMKRKGDIDENIKFVF